MEWKKQRTDGLPDGFPYARFEYVCGPYRIKKQSDRPAQWWLYFEGRPLGFGPRRLDAMIRAEQHANEVAVPPGLPLPKESP